VVVLPTPPFWFKTAMMFLGIFISFPYSLKTSRNHAYGKRSKFGIYNQILLYNIRGLIRDKNVK
jgi:hypothetical protein